MAGVGNAGARMWGSGGMAFAVTLIGRGRAGQFVRMANVCLGGVMSGLIWGELIWGGALAWEVLRLGGVGALRWDSGLRVRSGGVGRVRRLLRRLRRHLRTARRSMQITSGCFLRLYPRAHRRKTCPSQLVSRFRFHCQLCWRARRNAARGLVLLARL